MTLGPEMPQKERVAGAAVTISIMGFGGFLLLVVVMIWPVTFLYFYVTGTDQKRKAVPNQPKPESIRLRNEPKKSSDSAWRDLPSQREIKSRGGRRRDTGPYYVDEQWQDDAGNWVS